MLPVNGDYKSLCISLYEREKTVYYRPALRYFVVPGGGKGLAGLLQYDKPREGLDPSESPCTSFQ
jgi:hypothetical protein